LVKIDDEMDIRSINRELRTLKFIAKVMLTKYQRFMIPFFKENLLELVKVQGEEDLQDNIKDLKLKDCLDQTIYSAHYSKLDKRVLKNIHDIKKGTFPKVITKLLSHLP